MIHVIAHGRKNHARVDYMTEAHIHGGGPARFKGGPITNLYQAGAERNIATFHEQVVMGDFANHTVRRSIDGCLACILGREAAARGTELTMEQLLNENRRLEVDLTGLKS